MPGERASLKTLLARVWFRLISVGNLTIYYTTGPDNIITHTSYVIGKCFKFPFMKKGDYEIGPCFTHPQYRGQGIYPAVLRFITETISTKGDFYMLVKPANKSSIRGIEKAGFTRVGNTVKTKLKRYIQIK